MFLVSVTLPSLLVAVTVAIVLICENGMECKWLANRVITGLSRLLLAAWQNLVLLTQIIGVQRVLHKQHCMLHSCYELGTL